MLQEEELRYTKIKPKFSKSAFNVEKWQRTERNGNPSGPRAKNKPRNKDTKFQSQINRQLCQIRDTVGNIEVLMHKPK